MCCVHPWFPGSRLRSACEGGRHFSAQQARGKRIVQARASAGASGCELPSKAATAPAEAQLTQLLSRTKPAAQQRRQHAPPITPLCAPAPPPPPPGQPPLPCAAQCALPPEYCSRRRENARRASAPNRVPRGRASSAVRSAPSEKDAQSSPTAKPRVRLDGRQRELTRDARHRGRLRFSPARRACVAPCASPEAPQLPRPANWFGGAPLLNAASPWKPAQPQRSSAVSRSCDRRRAGARTEHAAAVRPRAYFVVAVGKVAAIAEAAALRRLKPARGAGRRQHQARHSNGGAQRRHARGPCLVQSTVFALSLFPLNTIGEQAAPARPWRATRTRMKAVLRLAGCRTKLVRPRTSLPVCVAREPTTEDAMSA